MHRSDLRRLAGTAAVCGALALTAACGSGSSTTKGTTSSGGSTPSASSSPSASPSTGSGTTTGTTLDAANFGTTLAAAQKKAGSYTFTITTSTAGKKITGSGEASTSGSTPEVHTSMGIEGQTVETILAGGFYYMKAPFLHTAKPWLKIDPHAKTGVGALIGQLGGNSDPAKNLAAMSAASSIKKVGTEDVGGVSTTHYTVVLPKAALVKALSYPAQVASLLPPTLTYDTWVGGDDLVRKVTSTISVQGTDSTTQILFADYGKSVSITAPPASQTTTKSPLGG